jgi:hypothetical protein
VPVQDQPGILGATEAAVDRLNAHQSRFTLRGFRQVGKRVAAAHEGEQQLQVIGLIAYGYGKCVVASALGAGTALLAAKQRALGTGKRMRHDLIDGSTALRRFATVLVRHKGWCAPAAKFRTSGPSAVPPRSDDHNLPLPSTSAPRNDRGTGFSALERFQSILFEHPTRMQSRIRVPSQRLRDAWTVAPQGHGGPALRRLDQASRLSNAGFALRST